MKVKDHNGDILKAKFYKETTLDSFSTEESLELLLYYATSQKKDTGELAKKLTAYFGSVSNAFDAPFDELTKFSDMTKHTAVLFKLIPDIARIYCYKKSKFFAKKFDFEKVGSYVASKFLGLQNESVLAIAYNSKLSIVSENMLRGYLPGAVSFDFKKMFGKFAGKNISYIVLAHNHPNASLEPSVEDIYTTQNVQKFLKEINIELLEHYITSKGKFRGILNHSGKDYLMTIDI